MPRAIIFASYLEHPVDLSSLLQPEDDIICLDGGYDIARAAHLQPKLLLGDFDSLEGSLPEDPAIEIRRYPPEKDYTDLELAFRILDPEKTPEILVIGGLGGRLDQTLTNVQMLANYTAGPAEPGYRRITLMDGCNQCFAIKGDGAVSVCRIPRREHCYLSFLPLSDQCCGLTIRGAKYLLEDADILRGASHCVSNEFDGPQAEVTLGSGTLLVVVAQGNNSDLL